MKRASIVAAVALALVVGMAGVSGAGLADSTATADDPVTQTTAEQDGDPPICWGVTEDPWGMPVYYPYPCLK